MIKDIFFLIALVFFACVDSWGACTTSTCGYWQNYGSSCGSSLGSVEALNDCNCSSYATQSHNGNSYSQLLRPRTNFNGSKFCFGHCSFRNNLSYDVIYKCDTQAEADSVACAQNPDLPQCPKCDSTAWTCNTETTTTQTTIANENVTCFNGECYGGIYCEYITRNETTCTNECGTTHTEIAEFPMRYEGSCNSETAPDEDQCTTQKCMTNNGFYHLYRLCKNRNLINGEAQTIPVFEGGGVGTCANAGYKEENPNVNGGSSSPVDSSSVPQECYTMGINCPVPADTTDYSEQSNRTQQNGCTCEKYDGTFYISRIICPDGSSSIFFGSCDDWKPKSSSSESTPPESSSSGSENPPTSSGGSEVGPTDWVNYSQGEEMKALLGQIALNTQKQVQVTINNQSNLNDYAYTGNDEDLVLNRTDSVLVLEGDTNAIMALRDSLFNRIFNRIDTNNTLIDTIPQVSYSGCPAVRLMGGGAPVQTQSGVLIRGFTIDFCDVHGFDLVRIISVIVTSFASVVAFFIGFKIFNSASG